MSEFKKLSGFYDIDKIKSLGKDEINSKSARFRELKNFLEDLNATTIRKLMRRLPDNIRTLRTRRGIDVLIENFQRLFVVELPSELREIGKSELLWKYKRIKKIDKDRVMQVDTWPPNDPYYSYQNQFYSTYYNIDLPRAWNFTAGNSGIKVAIVDHGVDYSHPDLGAGIGEGFRVRGGWDFKDNDSEPLPTYSTETHATPIAGMIGALNWNNTGVIGIAGGSSSVVESGCQLFSFRVTSEDIMDNGLNGMQPSLVSEAVFEAATDPALNNGFGYGVHVINHSGSGTDPNVWDWNSLSYHSYYESFVWAYLNNVVVTVSRGNYGNTEIRYPANFSNGDVLLSVSGVDNGGTLHSSSSYGDGVTISSPWSLNMTTGNGNTYQSFNGTSNAAPMVAGVAALVLSKFLERSMTAYAEDVREILKISAQPTGDPQRYGAGRLDAGKALYLSSKIFKLQHLTATKNRMVDVVQNPSGDRLGLYYPFGVYIVQQTKRITASIDVPEEFINDSSWVWANSYSEGLKWGSPSYGMQGASLVSHNGREWTFQMYAYELRDISGDYLGWYPYDPSTANIRVTVLGKDAKTLYVPEQYSSLSSALSAAVSGQTVVVSGTQSVSGYLSINSGIILRLEAGSTLAFGPNSRLLVNGGSIVSSGTSSSHVTLDGQNYSRSGYLMPLVLVYTGGSIHLDYTDIKNTAYGINVYNTAAGAQLDYCTFSNFSTIADARAISIWNATSAVTLNGCNILGTSGVGYGIYISGSQQPVTISGTSVSGCNYGIYSYNTGTNVSISNNTISSSGAGIRCYSSNAMLTGNTIQNNTVYGIQVDYVSNSAQYHNNRVSSNGYCGISFNGSNPYLINNFIYLNFKNVYITSSSPQFADTPFGHGHNVIAMAGAPLIDVQNSSTPFLGYYSAGENGGYNSLYETDYPHITAQYNSHVSADVNYWGDEGPVNWADGTSSITNLAPLWDDPNPYPLAKAVQIFVSQSNTAVPSSLTNASSPALEMAIAEGLKGDYAKAKQLLEVLIGNNPLDNVAPIALVYFYDFSKLESQIDASTRLKNENEFNALVDGLINKSTNNPLRPFALRLLARDAALAKDFNKTNALYDELLSAYPNSRFELTTLYDLVVKLVEVDRDLPKAQELVAKMVANYPKDVLTAMGRIAVGDKVEMLKSSPQNPESKQLTSNPAQFKLGVAYPNPFNPATKISFELPSASYVKLTVYDVLGREVCQLANGEQTAGKHTVTFDGKNLPSGIYVYRLEAGRNTAISKMLLTK
jgi:parallel beta-helix repeat protein